MMKFLRRARRKLLGNANFKKYGLYVVGEVLLIVLGILIALQISNWSEGNKKRAFEADLLREIEVDLRDTRTEIMSDLESHIEYQQSGNIFRNHLLTVDELPDSLLRHLEKMSKDRQVYPSTSGYQLLISKGVDVISNDTLRVKINQLYELGLSRLIEYGSNNQSKSISYLMKPHLKKYLYLTNEVDNESRVEGLGDPIRYYKYLIKNYEQMRTDQDFLYDLQHAFDLRRSKIKRHQNAVAFIDELLKDITAEIERLD